MKIIIELLEVEHRPGRPFDGAMALDDDAVGLQQSLMRRQANRNANRCPECLPPKGT